MCVILYLKAGYTLPKSLLYNACHNNPDGWGLIVKKDNQLTVTKDLPKGGNDPDVVYKMLKDHEDAERFLHVRNKTAGDISIENTQPFKVYDDRGREVWFMHNGTLSSYTPSYTHWNSQNQKTMSPEYKKSDSLKFAETVLGKYLPKFIGENGVADYHDEVVQEFLVAKWSGTNRGILVSNDLEPFYLGENHWEIIKTSEVIDGKEVAGEFFASNNDYFERLKRGPLFEKLEEARRKKEEEERKQKAEKEKVENKKTEALDSSNFLQKYSLSEGIADTLEDYNIFQKEGFVQLANLTFYEWLAFVSKADDEDVSTLFLYLTDYLKASEEELALAEGRITELEKGLKVEKNAEAA